jgi:hypothetical protein
MVQNFKLFIQGQFFIKQHHQLFKTACVHGNLSVVNLLTSELRLKAQQKFLDDSFSGAINISPKVFYSTALMIQDQSAKVLNLK